MKSKFGFLYTDQFLKNFAKLDPKSQVVIREAIKVLAQDPLHPSLRAKRVQGTKSVWEASADMDLRITWRYDGPGVIIVRNCGYHDRALRNP